MNDQNRHRLEKIAARHASRPPQEPSPGKAEGTPETNVAFLTEFGRIRDEVLRPVMAEVGIQLKRAGYDFRIIPGGTEASPAVDFRLLIPDRGDSKDTIRFFAKQDPNRGWQVISELDLKRSPVELTRFEAPDEITHDVAEQLLVDAVEQMFASVGSPPPLRSEPAPSTPDPMHTPCPVGVPPVVAPTDQDSPEEVVVTKPEGVVEHAPPRVDPAPALHVPSAPTLELSPHASEARGGRWASAHDAGGTEEVNVAAFRALPLPFMEGPPPPEFFAEVEALRAAGRENPPRVTGRETQAMPAVQTGAIRDERADDATRLLQSVTSNPALTVENYAALCAALTVFPTHSVLIHERYGCADANARAALDDQFTTLFASEPSLRVRWHALVVHYEGWFRANATR